MPIKVRKYNQFIKIFNEKLERSKLRHKAKFQNVEKNLESSYNPLPTIKDAWLCGFTDAEGCFYTGFTKDLRIRGCFDLTQKENLNHSCFFVFDHIQKNIFQCGHLNLKGSDLKKNSYIELRSSSLSKDLFSIHAYYNNFILKTSKINSFLLQKEIIYRLKEWKESKVGEAKKKEQLLSLIKHSTKTNKGKN